MYKIKDSFWRANLAINTCSRRGPRPASRAGNRRSPKAPKMVQHSIAHRFRRAAALALVVVLCALPARAGVVIHGTQGVVFTGADGIYYDQVSGLSLTGLDALTFQVNGIAGTSTTNGVV